MPKINTKSAVHRDCIGSLHTFDECIKYSESTVGIVTDVIPAIFTVD